MEKINIYKIAKMANVSHMTVSRVFNSPEKVNIKTREKIIQLANEYNFKPSMIAKSMRTKKSRYIALILPEINNPISPEIIKGVSTCVDLYKFNLIISDTDYNPQKQNDALDMLISRGVDGIILNGIDGSKNDYEAIKKMKDNNIPYVLIDKFVANTESSYAAIDNIDVAFKATNYLIELGHSKIALITSPPLIMIYSDRIKGYKKALKKNNIDFNKELVFMEEKETITNGYNACENIFSKFRDVTAILAVCDFMALGVYQYCKAKKISIPKDVSVMGIDDIFVSSLITPPLTTIAQKKYELGYAATEILMNNLKNNNSQVKKVILDTELIIRESCMKLDKN